MYEQESLVDQARMLVLRLERISVDSIWARRASGLRGSLLKWIERADRPGAYPAEAFSPKELILLDTLVRNGYEILENAAREQFPLRD